MILRVLVRLFSFVLLFYLLGYATFVVLLPQPAGDERTDAIVVLTGGARRIERGIDLLQRQAAGRLLISGVDRSVRPQELAARYRVEPRLFECCIDLGREAIDTRSNGDEVARWVERRRFRSVRLVTTDWHMRRAHFEIANRVGDDVTILTDAVRSMPTFEQLFKEYNKFLLRQAAVLVGI